MTVYKGIKKINIDSFLNIDIKFIYNEFNKFIKNDKMFCAFILKL